MVGKSKESVWVLLKKFAPHLNSLQKRTEITGGGPMDREEVIAQYWEKVGSNLMQLAEQLDSQHKARHIQLQVVTMNFQLLTHVFSHTAYRFDFLAAWNTGQEREPCCCC